MRRKSALLTALLGTLLLTACAEHNGPMERAGRSIDHAANVTAGAVGKAMEKTGAAIEHGGQKVQDKVDQKASGKG